jgi:hypothetical protein
MQQAQHEDLGRYFLGESLTVALLVYHQLAQIDIQCGGTPHLHDPVEYPRKFRFKMMRVFVFLTFKQFLQSSIHDNHSLPC